MKETHGFSLGYGKDIISCAPVILEGAKSRLWSFTCVTSTVTFLRTMIFFFFFGGGVQ